MWHLTVREPVSAPQVWPVLQGYRLSQVPCRAGLARSASALACLAYRASRQFSVEPA
jgi:hypothetical protein